MLSKVSENLEPIDFHSKNVMILHDVYTNHPDTDVFTWPEISLQLIAIMISVYLTIVTKTSQISSSGKVIAGGRFEKKSWLTGKTINLDVQPFSKCLESN